jgi:AraC-like DNA-binding protein
MGGSRRPAPPLDAFIETLWASERRAGFAHAREWNLPTGCADLIVPLSQDRLHRYAGTADQHGEHHAGGVLQGPQQQATLRDTAGALAVVGAHFRPAGLAAFFGEPAEAFTDRCLPLDSLWPGFGSALREQLHPGGRLAEPAVQLDALEGALLGRLRSGAADGRADPLLAWAWPRLAQGTSIGQLQQASGWSPARFIDQWRSSFGLAPKRHAALLRFNRLLALGLPARGWAGPALDAGYADQAHLVREFRRFAGFTPGHYQRHATAFSHHVVWR